MDDLTGKRVDFVEKDSCSNVSSGFFECLAYSDDGERARGEGEGGGGGSEGEEEDEDEDGDKIGHCAASGYVFTLE